MEAMMADTGRNAHAARDRSTLTGPTRAAVHRLCALFAVGVVVTHGSLVSAQIDDAEIGRRIEIDNIRRHIGVLASDAFEGRGAGTQGGAAAGSYLISELRKFDVQPAGTTDGFDQPFGKGWRNILCRIPGADPVLREQVILVGAHYDHVGRGENGKSFGAIGQIHNGADDNASGVSTILEFTRIFSSTEHRCRRSIVFAFWDGEEQGLLGSKHWVAEPTVALDRVAFVVNVDMIGRLDQRGLEMLGVRTASGLRNLVTRHNHTPPLTIDFNWEIRPDSDHYSFFERQIPYLMPFTRIHDDYHRPGDDIDKLNLRGLEQIARLVSGVVQDLADADRSPTFRPESEHETRRQQRALERTAQSLPPRLGIAWQAADNGRSVVVREVRDGSPAADAGVQPDDRVVAFSGKDVTPENFRALVAAADRDANITIDRPAGQVTLKIRMTGEAMRIGVMWRLDSAEPDCVILTRVVPQSAAAKAQLQSGDRILSVSNTPVHDTKSFESLLTVPARDYPVEFERNGIIQTTTIVAEP